MVLVLRIALIFLKQMWRHNIMYQQKDIKTICCGIPVQVLVTAASLFTIKHSGNYSDFVESSEMPKMLLYVEKLQIENILFLRL